MGVPGGALAPGALISIDGLRFIPNRTIIEIVTPKRTWQAVVLESSAEHLLARMPEMTDRGKAMLYAVADSGRSAGTEIRLAPTAPGIYTLNGLGWGAIAEKPFTQGASIELSSTGIGRIAARFIELYVAGRTVQLSRSDTRNGKDRLTFHLPPGLHGCTIPITLVAAGAVSNTATIDIADDCAGEHGREQGEKASVVLMRSDVILELSEGKPRPFLVDAVRAGFDQWSVKGLQTLFAVKPAPGGCVAWSGQINQEDLVLPALVQQAAGAARQGDPLLEGSPDLRDLDVGPSITIRGPVGTHESKQSTQKPQVYTGVLGGNPPLSSVPPTPPFLAPGEYAIRIPGGADVGPADIAVSIPEAGRWKSRDSTKLISRSLGMSFDWQATPGYGVLAVIGNINRRQALAGFTVCQPTSGVSQFRVPSWALQNLPLTGRGPSDLSLGFAGVLFIAEHPVTVQAPGKERLSVYFVSLSGRSVVIQ
jgi:hypothetical protein